MRAPLLLCALCACKEPEPTLAEPLGGSWYGYVDIDDVQSPALVDLVYSEEELTITEGELTIDERGTYTMLSFNEVEIGVSFAFIEVGGVHEVYLDALEPLTPFWWGQYRERWFCEGEGDGYCDVSGIFRFDPRE